MSFMMRTATTLHLSGLYSSSKNHPNCMAVMPRLSGSPALTGSSIKGRYVYVVTLPLRNFCALSKFSPSLPSCLAATSSV